VITKRLLIWRWRERRVVDTSEKSEKGVFFYILKTNTGGMKWNDVMLVLGYSNY